MSLTSVLLTAFCMALIGWRILDPVGSYEMLFWSIDGILGLFQYNTVLTRGTSIWLLDQFNSVMTGIVLTSTFSLAVKTIRWTIVTTFRLILGNKRNEKHT